MQQDTESTKQNSAPHGETADEYESFITPRWIPQNVATENGVTRFYSGGTAHKTPLPLTKMLTLGDKVGPLGQWARYNMLLAGDHEDAQTFRRIVQVSRSLRASAHEQDITLSGDHWVDPAPLQPHADMLCALLNRARVSAVYRDWQTDRNAALAERIAQSPYLHKAIAKWPRLIAGQQIRAAQTINKLQMNTFSASLAEAPRISAAFMSAARPAQDPDTAQPARLVRGTHRSPVYGGNERHLIDYNIHPDAGFDDPARALDVIFHENIHATQFMLAQVFDKGLMTSDHPLYRDAQLIFLAQETMTAYLPTIRPVYRAHTLEEDAFRAARQLTAMTAEKLRPHGINLTLPPAP